MAEFPQIDFGLAVPVFKQGDDPIDAINKMISFLSTVITSRFSSTNNQLRNSSNPRQQVPTHHGRVTTMSKAKEEKGCYVVQGKVLLVEAQGNEGPITQAVITHNATYQVDDLDAYDSDCDEISTAKTVLMANLSSYGSNVLSEVPINDNANNDMLNQSVHEMPYSEPSHFMEHPENEIHSDSNIISYSQYLIGSQNAAVHDTNSSAQQDALILSVFEQLSNQVTKCNKVNNVNLIANESLFDELERYKERVKLLEERQNVDLGTREKLIINDIIWDNDAQFTDFEMEINSLKQTLFEQLKEKESLIKTFNIFKNESKEKEARNINKEIAMEKKVKELDNISLVNILSHNENCLMNKLYTLLLTNLLLRLSKLRLPENFQNIVNIVVNSSVDVNTYVKVNSSVVMNDSVNYVEICNNCLKLKDELIKEHNMVEKDEYNRLSKRFSKLEQHCISLEIAMQLNKEIFQKNNTSVNQTESLFDQLFELNNLNAELQAKDTTIKKKLKGKEIADNAAQMSNAATIATGMYKLDPVILAPKVKNNREARKYNLKHTMEQAAILRELIQELLGYVRDTCSDIHKPSEKLVAVTPINKKKTVQFMDNVTSSGNIPKVTNRPLLSSTGVNPSTSSSKQETIKFRLQRA
ncbi:hypothetical protein Tco_0600814 [Tanacetum coccineum]